MKFMLMLNSPYEYSIESWPQEAVEAHMAYWGMINRELREAGELVEVQGLMPPRHARVVRAGVNGVPAVTDGPFPEAKEWLAGYWMVDVDSPGRAYEIAARASAAPGPGGEPLIIPLEVRQVMAAPAPADG
jgi:hypothetical protein